MEFWTEVRRRVLTKQLSKRAACREYELSWHTLKKILTHPEPPGYRKKGPRRKPTLEPFLPIIHQILEDDKQAPRKQRHTAKRIFERLRDEHHAIRSSRTPCGIGSRGTKRGFCRSRIHRAKRKSISARPP